MYECQGTRPIIFTTTQLTQCLQPHKIQVTVSCQSSLPPHSVLNAYNHTKYKSRYHAIHLYHHTDYSMPTTTQNTNQGTMPIIFTNQCTAYSMPTSTHNTSQGTVPIIYNHTQFKLHIIAQYLHIL